MRHRYTDDTADTDDTANTDDSDKNGNSSYSRLSTGAIIGIVVGGCAFLLLILLLHRSSST